MFIRAWKVFFETATQPIELLNNKSHLLSFSGGFASLFFDQIVPYYSQRHLADRNVICILHRKGCARLLGRDTVLGIFQKQKNQKNISKRRIWKIRLLTWKKISEIYLLRCSCLAQSVLYKGEKENEEQNRQIKDNHLWFQQDWCRQKLKR